MHIVAVCLRMNKVDYYYYYYYYVVCLLTLQVTCLTVHENLNYMAVGFENGSIVLFRGDVMRER